MGKMGENPKKKKNEKELGLVVSQQTLIRNQAELSSLKKGEIPKKEKHEKELGLVVSQQTVIRNQAKTQLPQKRKNYC